ncbi:MAG: helix-hairpin-helix domain-containing protein [Synergistaceae bacterium]|jgi:competence protein ComEA|nr:helix-hairpin-helix domain-containing protein [Synergistaceae bacterium]
MIRLRDREKRWILGIGGTICLVAAFTLVSAFHGKFADKSSAPTAPDEFVAEQEADPRGGDAWMVYVTGAVMNPGVYEVPAGSRIMDAVTGAGGFSSNADPEAINLAERIEDEAHIRVPRKGEDGASGTLPASPSGERISGSSRGISDAAAIPSVSRRPSMPAGDAARININSATVDEMLALPGIGHKLSQAIVSHRERNGPFSAAEDLMSVKGIGAKRFEALKDLVSVGN